MHGSAESHAVIDTDMQHRRRIYKYTPQSLSASALIIMFTRGCGYLYEVYSGHL